MTDTLNQDTLNTVTAGLNAEHKDVVRHAVGAYVRLEQINCSSEISGKEPVAKVIETPAGTYQLIIYGLVINTGTLTELKYIYENHANLINALAAAPKREIGEEAIDSMKMAKGDIKGILDKYSQYLKPYEVTALQGTVCDLESELSKLRGGDK